MFFLHILPEWILAPIINGLLGLGIIGTIATLLFPTFLVRWFPAVVSVFRGIQLASVVILLLGVFLSGAYNTEIYWRDKLKDANAQIKAAEEKSKLVNEVIKEKIVYKTRIIKQKAATVTSQIANNPKLEEFDKKCPLPEELFKLHNEAVRINSE